MTDHKTVLEAEKEAAADDADRRMYAGWRI
jgi:hypothetical protein